MEAGNGFEDMMIIPMNEWCCVYCALGNFLVYGWHNTAQWRCQLLRSVGRLGDTRYCAMKYP